MQIGEEEDVIELTGVLVLSILVLIVILFL